MRFLVTDVDNLDDLEVLDDVEDATGEESFPGDDYRPLTALAYDGDNLASPPPATRANTGSSNGATSSTTPATLHKEPIALPATDTTATPDKGRRRRRSRLPKLKDMPLKPKGAAGGPLRTPLHIGDNWQHMASYAVEKVRLPNCNQCPRRLFCMLSGFAFC